MLQWRNRKIPDEALPSDYLSVLQLHQQHSLHRLPSRNRKKRPTTFVFCGLYTMRTRTNHFALDGSPRLKLFLNGIIINVPLRNCCTLFQLKMQKFIIVGDESTKVLQQSIIVYFITRLIGASPPSIPGPLASIPPRFPQSLPR